MYFIFRMNRFHFTKLQRFIKDKRLVFFLIDQEFIGCLSLPYEMDKTSKKVEDQKVSELVTRCHVYHTKYLLFFWWSQFFWIGIVNKTGFTTRWKVGWWGVSRGWWGHYRESCNTRYPQYIVPTSTKRQGICSLSVYSQSWSFWSSQGQIWFFWLESTSYKAIFILQTRH